MVQILEDCSSLPDLIRQLTSVVGSKPETSTENEASWALEIPRHVSQPLESVAVTIPCPRLILSVAQSSDELRHVETEGAEEPDAVLFEVGFWVDGEKTGSTQSSYGRITWLPLR